jgi:hypothetical protein
MTKKETIQIMALLSAFYGAGKGNPEVMAEGWYWILEPYDYEMARRAVLTYARNDTREYGTFPTVGNIVKCIEEEMRKDQAPIKEIVRNISYGRDYSMLTAEAKSLISQERYDAWLKMDAEEFANKSMVIAETLKSERKRLQG